MSPKTISGLALIAASAIPLAACSAQMDDEREVTAPAIKALGPEQNCINATRIDRTEVHDDYTIDFVMLDGTRYRNTLPDRCFSLGFEESFAYDRATTQLCSVDTIQVLYSDGTRGQSCPLGPFLPVELITE